MSYSYKVIYSPKSVEDLRKIDNYISYKLCVPTSAKKLIFRIKKHIHSLNEMPYRYSKFSHEPWLSYGVRKISIDNFLVLYTVDDTHRIVMILRIVYGGMNLTMIKLE